MFGWLGPVFALLARFGPWVVLAAVLLLTGIVLALLGAVFGFSLDDVDIWLAAHGGLFNAAGSLLFRIGCGLVLLLCAATLLGAIFARRTPESGPGAPQRDLIAPEPRLDAPESGSGEPETEVVPPQAPGWGCALLAIPVGYFAWIGMTMPS